MNFEQHPLCAAFPAMSADDFQSLVDDIGNNGQREPIIIFEGKVLDGWHRYQACLKSGLPVTKFEFGDDDPVAFVLSSNLHRRHLTASQRAAAVLACEEYGSQGRPNKRGNVAPLLKTVGQLATEAQVSPRVIKDAAVAKKAGLLDEVRDGTISASKAAEMGRGKPAKDNPAPPTPTPADDGHGDAIAILSEENDRLNTRLAVDAMDATEEEKTMAAELIDGLQRQVKTLTAELDAVKASRDSYMMECSELKRQCASYKRQIDKMKK